MTTFEDGPAKGEHLMLRRAPVFLRVVKSEQWDALDQPEDSPKADEVVYAYVLIGEPIRGFINRGGGKGGPFVAGTYKLVKTQPDDATLRDNQQWRDWVEKSEPPQWLIFDTVEQADRSLKCRRPHAMKVFRVSARPVVAGSMSR